MKRALSAPVGVFVTTALLVVSAASAAVSPVPPERSGTSDELPGTPVEAPAALPATASPAVAFASAAERGTPAATEPPRLAELPNFHRVDDKLYRGGEPRAGGMARLKTLGVATVLDLRHEKRKARAERAEAEAAGLRYVNIPMYGVVRPTEAQIQRALAIIVDPANGPVFVHCERGSDRTGVVVACYRVARMQWSAERAIEEAMGLGMYRIERAKRSYIRDFSARLGE